MSASAVVTDVPLKAPKHILVAGHKIRFRLPQSIAWGYVAGTLATAAVAAGYYLLTQKGFFFAKSSWDHLIKYDWWSNYRHGIRNVGEGVLSAMAISTFLGNSWKKHPEQRLSGLALTFRIILVLVASFAAIIFGVWVLDYSGPWAWHKLLSHHHVSVTGVPTWVGSATSQVSLGAFALGFVVTHFVTRKLWEPVGNTISLALLEGSVYRANGRTPVWVKRDIAPPAVRERFSWIQETTPHVKAKGDIATRLVTLITILCVPLAGYGIYILHWVAKGH